MRGNITMERLLPLAGPIHKMVPAIVSIWKEMAMFWQDHFVYLYKR